MACPLTYTLTLTGDCSNTNSGVVLFNIDGTAPPYTISGGSGTYTIPSSGTTYTETGLSAGPYQYIITDSCLPANNSILVNVNVSSGSCVTILESFGTTCDLNNGSITAQTSNFYGYSNFYLYTTGSYVTSATSFSSTYIFNDLPPSIYYVIADDGGGCTGQSESCIIKRSDPLDYGFYVVNDTPCSLIPTSGIGKIFITGLTGTGPYTYLWSNGETTSSISGLTAGTYTLTITDASGCSTTKGTNVEFVNPPIIVATYVTQPTCFSANGEVTIVIQGGTPPYYLSTSSGIVDITLNTTYTFTGISAGYLTISATDAGLCNFSTIVDVTPPSSFNIININVTNSNCNDLNGEISVAINGGSAPYTYSLTDSSGNTTNIVKDTTSLTNFENLSSGTYTLSITDGNGSCTYVNTYSISNTIKFIVTASTTGTTCNLSNGLVQLGVSGGSGTYEYQITGQPPIVSSFSSYTFSNLSSGNYLAKVTDLSDLCVQYLNFNIAASTSVDFSLVGINTFAGNDGEIYAFITEGTPPFTLTWSPNVNGQSGIHLTGLTAGTYSLTIVDDSGCTQSRSVSVQGYNKITSTQTYNICEDTFSQNGTQIKGIKEMFFEGYYDLTSGETTCIFNQSVFSVETIVSGVSASTTFYVSNNLNDYPSSFQFAQTIVDTLETYEEIGSVIIDVNKNTIQIFSNCDPTLPLMDTNIIVRLKIEYDISCVCCTIENGVTIQFNDLGGTTAWWWLPFNGYDDNGYPIFSEYIYFDESETPLDVSITYNNLSTEWELSLAGELSNTSFDLYSSGWTASTLFGSSFETICGKVKDYICLYVPSNTYPRVTIWPFSSNTDTTYGWTTFDNYSIIGFTGSWSAEVTGGNFGTIPGDANNPTYGVYTIGVISDVTISEGNC